MTYIHVSVDHYDFLMFISLLILYVLLSMIYITSAGRDGVYIECQKLVRDTIMKEEESFLSYEYLYIYKKNTYWFSSSYRNKRKKLTSICLFWILCP